MRALISSCEYFTRSMALPRQIENEKANPKSVTSNHSPLGGTSYYDDREDSHISRHVEEGRKRQETEDTELTNEFRKPRDLFLNVIAEFYSTCQPRLKSNELRRMLVDAASRPPTELLDHRSHNRLAEIANTLLKLAPYDPQTLSCTGLQRYMTEILPLTNWKQEAVRPGLNLILRRLDRLFNKISKKSSLRRQADWNAAANLLQDICECAAGDCVGGSGGTCSTRDHLWNPRQPPQRVWSGISHRPTHILFSCGQTCSNADASIRGPVLLGANLWRECVCFS